MKITTTVIIVITIVALLMSCARALDGELAGSRFPYVVKISTTYTKPKPYTSGCSASVINPYLLLTSTHCISKPYWDVEKPGNWFNNVGTTKILYVDARGVSQTISAKTTFWNNYWQEYSLKSEALRPQRENATTADSKKQWEAMTSEQKRAWSELRGKSIAFDLAYIVPERPVIVSEYPRWIFDDLKPVQYLDGSQRWALDRSGVDRTKNLFNASYTITSATTVMIVGLGLAGCEDKEVKKTCRYNDNKRRWAEAPVSTPYGTGNASTVYKFNDTLEFPWGPPFMTRSGAIGGKTPMNHGDSGGPVMLKNDKGQWTIVGVNSSMGEETATHPSPLVNPSLYYMAINSEAYRAVSNRGR